MLRLLVHGSCGLSLAVLLFRVFAAPTGALSLGPDPAEAVTHHLGISGLVLLLVTLALTPLSRHVRWLQLVRYRRATGLWAFAYLVLHALAYTIFWAGGVLAVVEDLAQRPYVLMGMTGLVLLVPLAVTSTNGWRRRLGRRWRTLHRLVYVATIAGCIHVVWAGRGDFTEPLIYTTTALALLGVRLLDLRGGRRPPPPVP